MAYFPRLRVGLVSVVLACWSALAFAQPDESPKKEPAPPVVVGEKVPADSPVAASREIDSFLLRDSKGNLVLVPGMTFERLEKLLKLEQGLAPAPPPPFVLDGLSISGSVQKELASLEVTVTVRIRDEGWVRVPLKMNKGILRDVPNYSGPGEQFITFDAAEGYQCWLKGADSKPHVVKLSFLFAVLESGTQSRLEMLLPRATESSLRLQVPLDKAEGALKPASEGIVSAKSLGGGQSEIEVIGPAGDLQLSWQPAQAMSAEGKQLLDAGGEILVSVEGRNLIRSDARLKVRSFGSPVETFQVRLPAGMEWIPTNPTGYTVAPVPTGNGQKAQTLEVKLDRPSSGTVELRLLASLAPGAESAGGAFEPARFEVLGAVRQRGVIDFAIQGDWSLEWTEDASTRRVDVPAEVSAAVKSVARFEYFRQPCGLQLKVATRPTRLVIEPSYVISIEPQLISLEATLKCRVRGARPARLGMALGDWQLDRAGPESLVELESLDVSQKPLSIPLKAGPGGEMELKLQLHREIAPGSSRIAFDLPRPVADLLDPATVIVLAADNVEISPRAREITGLMPDTARPEASFPTRQQLPLVFRDVGFAGSSQFSADFQVRTRQVTVDAKAEVKFTPQTIAVEQRLEYRILYEPQRTFTFLVPETLAARGDIKVLLGGETLLLVPAPSAGAASGPNTARYQATAAQGQLGKVDLVLQYSAPMPQLSSANEAEVAIPLMVPAEDEVTSTSGQSLHATWGESLEVDLVAAGAAGGFQPVVEASSAGELRASSPRLLTAARWKVRQAEPGEGSSVAVSRLWLQSLLTSQGRQDRAAWKLRTAANELTLRFPPGTQLESIVVAIDGQKRPAVWREREALHIPLPENTDESEMVLEAWFTLPAERSFAEGIQSRLRAPSLQGVSHVRAVYWQVCLPADRHLLADPAGFIPEMRYAWRAWFWDRRGVLSQEELEAWSGASRQQALPAETNQYLFSSFGTPDTVLLTAVPRRAILAVAGALVLGLGLLVLHVSWVRHPAMVLVLAVAVAVAGLNWPSIALMLAQAASLALLVVGLAALWHWGTSGRPAWPGENIPTPVMRERPSTTAAAQRAESVPPASTATAPLVGASEARP